MINLTKTVGISSTYRDHKGTTNWESLLFAKVVFIDQTNSSVKPRVYQLKDSALSNTPPDLLKSKPFSFQNDSFVLLGEVDSIDKSKKHISLSNNNLVSYTHLVCVSGSNIETSFHEPEFSAGLQILVDALRVMPFVPATPNTPSNTKKANKGSKKNPAPPQEENNLELEKLVHPYIIQAGEQAIAANLKSLTKRLYSVQL